MRGCRSPDRNGDGPFFVKGRKIFLILPGLFLFFALFFSNGKEAFPDESEKIYPSLVIFGTTWSYDYRKALSLSDLFEGEALRLRSYHCRVKTFYSLKRVGSPRQIGKTVRQEDPDEDFDYSVVYHPLTVSVRLNHPRRGATVVYREVDRVTTLHPFDFLPLTLSLSPHNRLITSRFGHTIDHSDVRSFYHRVFRPACLTHSCLSLGSGIFKGLPVDIVNIAPDQLEARPVFGRMWVLLDGRSKFPVSVATYGPDGRFWERIDYEGCQYFYR